MLLSKSEFASYFVLLDVCPVSLSVHATLCTAERVGDSSVCVCSRCKDRHQEQREQAATGDGHQRSVCLVHQEETSRQYVHLASRGQPCYESLFSSILTSI